MFKQKYVVAHSSSGVFSSLFLVVTLLITLVSAYFWWQASTALQTGDTLRVGTASSGGAYHKLGGGIATLIGKELTAAYGIDRAEAVGTRGSVDNLDMLGRKELDFALAQSDTRGNSNIRVIAPLYEEVLHILVRRDGFDKVPTTLLDIDDGTTHPAAIGPVGSGTRGAVSKVINHFGLQTAIRDVVLDEHDKGVEPSKAQFNSTKKAVIALREGRIDILFLFSGLIDGNVESLLRDEKSGIELIGLGQFDAVGTAIDGFRSNEPYYEKSLIPARAYLGKYPTTPIGTIAVTALFVTHKDMDTQLVYDVTRSIFQNKIDLIELHMTAAFIEEGRRVENMRFPYHPGAEAYNQRNAPHILVRYAETISLVIAVMAAIISGVLALRQWVRARHKLRVEHHLETLMQVVNESAGMAERLQQLHELRRKVMQDLVDERLECGRAVRALQSFLNSEVLAAECQIQLECSANPQPLNEVRIMAEA